MRLAIVVYADFSKFDKAVVRFLSFAKQLSRCKFGTLPAGITSETDSAKLKIRLPVVNELLRLPMLIPNRVLQTQGLML